MRHEDYENKLYELYANVDEDFQRIRHAVAELKNPEDAPKNRDTLVKIIDHIESIRKLYDEADNLINEQYNEENREEEEDDAYSTFNSGMNWIK